ncbi:erythromycin esterase family protein [Hymenobacter armeniacus]|uniref:Erythromycin esterase family protein n=1 Tax=Hymenobacter armeniacus TaxID=2771358 RepID=A0ABR8K0U7_9BACT|nr:erythromycin esterase family protein [Hymenobacter armeniacus]MBD2724682.1 erythromycin esterase family protein [Hymenobacter armeniacus]
MLIDCKAAALAGALLLAGAFAHAQAPAPLPTHAVRSIAPTDTDFRDLNFLKAEIGPARVVMLGEPTHGEGNVFEAKIRLLRFLREQMGFTTVAFESGFYDLHKAQQALEAGRPAREALGNSVFGVWTSAQEFQGVLPLVGRNGLRVAGFDPQLSGEYGGDLVDDLQAFLAPQKSAALLNYDYLESVIGFMGERFTFLPTTTLAEFEAEMAKATKQVAKAAASSDARRRTEAAFWQQTLRSLLAQARDYAEHDPTAKTEQEFKALDSNPRDAQMAANLLWYVQQHPQEKVVCWAALPHLANRTDRFDTAELQAYRPMGRLVKEALGPEQVYILGTLAGGGSHGFPAMGYRPVPVPAAGSLEAELLAQPADYAFVSLKHDAPGRELTTYAFDYTPMRAPWSEAVDGFLFLREVHPPRGARATASAALPAPADSASANSGPGSRNPAAVPRRVRAATAGAAVVPVRGVVLDRQTKAPVPYASVAVPGQGVGTVADGQGRFALGVPAGGRLAVSSVGYATASATPTAAALTVYLQPAAYELAGVQVRGESLDPRKIMKKVLAAAPQNYEQADYSAQLYTRRQVINFDTVRYESEYVSQTFEPGGYRNWNGGFMGWGPQHQIRVQEAHVLKRPAARMRASDIVESGQGFYAAAADPVRISPLFKTSTVGKFRFRLDSVLVRDGETVYLLSFAVKRATHRSTGTYLEAGYSGQLEIQQRDYAVTRYQALWQMDTVKWNAVAHKHAPKHDFVAHLYNTILTDSRTDHVVEYAKGANGRYHVRRSIGKGVGVGRVIGGSAFHTQKICDEYFADLPAGTALPPPNPKLEPRFVGHELDELTLTEFRPEFWQTYQRPAK